MDKQELIDYIFQKLQLLDKNKLQTVYRLVLRLTKWRWWLTLLVGLFFLHFLYQIVSYLLE